MNIDYKKKYIKYKKKYLILKQKTLKNNNFNQHFNQHFNQQGGVDYTLLSNSNLVSRDNINLRPE